MPGGINNGDEATVERRMFDELVKRGIDQDTADQTSQAVAAALTAHQDGWREIGPELYDALEAIANESVFDQWRFPEDDDTGYLLGCFKAVQERAREALTKARPLINPEGRMTDVKVGSFVQKVKGYRWPGVVVAKFTTQEGAERFVVECTVPEVAGALHIYNREQLALSQSQQALGGKAEMVAALEKAERGLMVATVASCNCDHQANISPEPEAHTDTCRYRVLIVAAHALADARLALASQPPMESVVEAIREARSILNIAPELNPSNYSHDEVVRLDGAATEAFRVLDAALAASLPANSDRGME